MNRGLRQLALTIMAIGALVSRGAAQTGPQTAVREFCQLDAFGSRVAIQTWPQVAPLVEWSLEPAWDEVVLITSYTVGWTENAPDNMLDVEVQYAVSGRVTAAGVHDETSIESVKYRVRGTPTNDWRIVGPPPPPHILATHVDTEPLRRSLERGGASFLPNSNFIFHLFRGGGWNIDWQPTSALLSGGTFRPVDKPKPGDLVLYLRDATPYHVGVLENEGVVVSSTLNAGIIRAPQAAFPGEVKYARLVKPSDPEQEETPVVDEDLANPEIATPKAEPTPKPKAKPTLKPKPKAKLKPNPDYS